MKQIPTENRLKQNFRRSFIYRGVVCLWHKNRTIAKSRREANPSPQSPRGATTG